MLIKLQENRTETSRTSKECIFLWALDSILVIYLHLSFNILCHRQYISMETTTTKDKAI